MKNLYLILCIGLLTGGCQSNAKKEILEGKVKRDALTIVSKYPGRIIEHFVEEGQNVQKGDTLALLDMPEVRLKKFRPWEQLMLQRRNMKWPLAEPQMISWHRCQQSSMP